MPIQTYACENADGVSTEKGALEVARFVVLFAKASTRKHKKWEGDGILVCFDDVALLKSENEKEVVCRTTTLKKLDELEDGKIILMGGYEVQIQERVPTQPQAGLAAEENAPNSSPAQFQSPQVLRRSGPLLKTFKSPAFFVPPTAPTTSAVSTPTRPGPQKRIIEEAKTFRLPAKKAFVSPVSEASNIEKVKIPPFVVNEMDVETSGAAPVLVDPKFAQYLRDHQKDGVKFIYDRLKGAVGGAILADEMGLGKSVQTIAATFALLKDKKSTITKCLLVVPSSLVNNWKCEFRKWFRYDRNPVMCMQKLGDLVSYACSTTYNPYLVVSYEMASRYYERLAGLRFDVIVCDEGHRLKNLNGKLRKAVTAMNIPRRLILTGTPMQNDLDELYSLLDFVRPQMFGTLAEFREKCTDEGSDLNVLISACVLRRTADVNMSHLPEKHEYVLFCKPSTLQRRVEEAVFEHTGDPLALVHFLRKLANHPAILYKKLDEQANGDGQNLRSRSYASLLFSFPKDFGARPISCADSGKLSALLTMMEAFRVLHERAVIVSNSTMTLDMIQMLMRSLGLRVYRLDGSTAVGDRQKLVNEFNDARSADDVFLLSTKAGGVGLNLIGASRLVLFDSDWNPANDLQAMARIWRDGQTRPCHIYRLISTGSIDEKILQRQIKKTGLSAVIDVMQMKECSQLDGDDLTDIFTVVESDCETHDRCQCDCDGNGLLPDEREDDDGEDVEEEEEQEKTRKTKGREFETVAAKGEVLYDDDDENDYDDEEEEGEDDDDDVGGRVRSAADGDEKEDDGSSDSQGSQVDVFKEPRTSANDDEPNSGSVLDAILAEDEQRVLKGAEICEPTTEEAESGRASMAELSRWRHFAPRHGASWKHFLARAGLGSVDAASDDQLFTFAFQLSSSF